jgi:hypothetical protein
MQAFARIGALLMTLAILGGCASGVTRMDSPGTATVASAGSATTSGTVRSVNLFLNEDAKKLVADNLKFNQDTLRSVIERALTAQNLIKPDSPETMDIEITDFRTRSNFSAIMFGFLAGNDSIEGVVTIKDAAGNVLKRAKVSASYALGGLAGGQDEARMNWLYESFAKYAVAELTGVPVK